MLSKKNVKMELIAVTVLQSNAAAEIQELDEAAIVLKV
jgi:hypothetical protein